MRARHAARLVPHAFPLVLLASLQSYGCGAKSGLHVPDAENVEVMDAGTDAALDAGPDADIPCIELPPDGGPIAVSLDTEAEVGRADVVFLIDTTASMGDEIDVIRRRLRDRLAPAIRETIPDSQLGVATFADFPVGGYGAEEDRPFELLLPVTEDIARVQAAVNAITLDNGRDQPESQTEALYQLATGRGIGGYVDPSAGCATGGLGYACFRRDSLPVVLLFTDAPFHNGPGGRRAYGSDISPPPAQFTDAVRELVALNARVIGFDSQDDGDQARADLAALARETRTRDGSGDPLVFGIGGRGERLSTAVVDAIRTFAGTLVIDIDVVVNDPAPGDGVDVTELVEAVVPVGASPMSGVREIDREAGIFRGVTSGTRVTYELLLRNDVISPGPEPQTFVIELVFRGDMRTRLGRQLVEVVIPSIDGAGCDAE